MPKISFMDSIAYFLVLIYLVYWVYCLVLLLKYCERSKHWSFTRKTVIFLSVFLVFCTISFVLSQANIYALSSVILYCAGVIFLWYVFVQKGACLFSVPFYEKHEIALWNNINQGLTGNSLPNKMRLRKKHLWVLLIVISLPILLSILISVVVALHLLMNAFFHFLGHP
jgi:hypothetical protein